ncbi:helix-turn-helix domain-containing protein [Melittangium boletus]|uniref:helix-turn-helix domain-containing protein n=1 Tax=Melittangium boletus TaxID=83453 RepID=UPI003DA21995
MAERQRGIRIEDARGKGRPVFVSRWAQHKAHEPAPRAVTHDYAVLGYCTAGTTTIEQRGHFTLQAGEVLLIPAGEPHRHVDVQRPEFWMLGFCPVCLLADEASAELLTPFEHVRSGASAVVKIPEPRRAFLEHLFVELRDESERDGGASPAVERSLLTLIISEVSRAADWQARSGAADGLVTETLRYIERHCLEPLSPRDVAAAMHRSPAHLTTAVRRATGRSVQEWIISGRMSEARRRLLHSDEIVAVIAERVGYADATHFIRLFRRAHGVTPTAWRARYRHGTGGEDPPEA